MKKVNVRQIAAAVAGSVIICLSTPVHADEITLDLSNEYSATSLVGLGDTQFAELVGKLSGDAVKVVPHFGGGLGLKSKDHFDAVGDGAVPIAGTYTGVFTGIDPIFALSAMPFLTPSVEDAKTMFEIARPYYDKVFAANNQKLLYASPYTPTGIWAKMAIRSAADLDGVKIRTYDAAGVDTLKALGATPVQLSWADTVPLLGAGGLDAVLTSDESGISGSLWDYLDHFNAIPYSVAINMTHMNLEVFEGLSPEQQAAIEEAAAETQESNWARVEARMVANAEVLKEKGVTVVEVSPGLLADLQKAADQVLSAWLADMGEDGQKILDAYHSATAE